MLLSQLSAFAEMRYGNIGPSVSALSLSKQRKVTVQIDIGYNIYSTSYVQDRLYAVLKPKLDAQNVELDSRVRSITTIDTVINSTAFSDDSENFYVSLSNSGYPEFSDPAKSANILNLFIEKQVAFVGIGSASNKSIIDTFIGKNQGNGVYIDNSNIDAALSRLGDYILGRTSVSLDLYVGDGANQDLSALQNKISSIVKPKLTAKNIDAEINIKMLKKETPNPVFNNFYHISSMTNGLYISSLNEYSPITNEWRVLYTGNILHGGLQLSLAYDGNLYFISKDLKLCCYKFSTNTVIECSSLAGVTAIAPSIDGKVYWARKSSYKEKTYDDDPIYSDVYAYDPKTNTNTFIFSTTRGWTFSRNITDMKVSLDQKLFYIYNTATYGNSGGVSILGGYDLKTKTKMISEESLTSYNDNGKDFYDVQNITILSNNRIYTKKSWYEDNKVQSYNIIQSGIDISSKIEHGNMSEELMYGSNVTIAGKNKYTNNIDIKKFGNMPTNTYVYSNINSNFDPFPLAVTPNGTVYYRWFQDNVYHLGTQTGKQTTFINAFAGYRYVADYPIIEIPIVEMKELDTTLQSKVFDASKDSYVAYLGDAVLPELNDTAKRTNIANKLISGTAKFVGLGTATNQSQFQNLISLNNNQGVFYNNSNLDTAINNLADYIIANTHQPDRSFKNYIVISEASSTIDTQEGALDSNGLPLYSTSYMRSKDYVDVTGGCSYTFTTTEQVNSFNLYWYTSTLQYIKKDSFSEPPTNIIAPANATYVKVVYSSNRTGIITTVINNTEASGENIAYSYTASDNENDNFEYIFRYSHDPLKINGVNIDNPSDKISLNDIDISIPINKFTKPGTYQISMYAKDIPKKIADTTNLLPNGDAEIVDGMGKLSDWGSWAANPSITAFTRRTTADWKISGNGSFEIVTSSVNDGSNNAAVYYKDVTATPNTSYTLSGLIGAHRCWANFVVYEMDNSYNVLKSINSPFVTNNTVPQTSSIAFTTGQDTTKLRIHIQKGLTTNYTASLNDYCFVDNITLLKMLPDTRFNLYRKSSPLVTSTLYAHRLPRANFSFQISNSAGYFSIKNLADNGLSFDPDHSSRADKGIIDRQWKWAQVEPDGTTTWHDGLVSDTQQFAGGSQILLWYRVRDIDGPGGKGAWSKPKLQRIDGQLSDPVALFIASPNPVPMQNQLMLSDQSYSTNYGGTIISRTWTIQKIGGTSQALTFDSTDVANGKYYKRFNSLGFGKYTITLTVTDSFGKISKPCSQTIDVIDTINPSVSVSPISGTFNSSATVNITGSDNTSGSVYNRGLKTISYVWSKNATAPQPDDTVITVDVPSEGTYTKTVSTTQTGEGTWHLYVKDVDCAGNTNANSGAYTRYGPYIVETMKASNFMITMMLDVGWRAYYFDLNNGIDDNHDGEIDRYPRRSNTDIGALKMPINYFSLVGHGRTYIKAGYKVKGKIDILGDPDWAAFDINYIINGSTYTNRVTLTRYSGNSYTFEWIIPLETDSKTFVSFDLVTKKGSMTYGNEKWIDTWDIRNTSRLVFYVQGKASDDLIYVQSQ